MSFNDFSNPNYGDLTKSNRQNSEARLGRIPRTTVNDIDYTATAKDYLIAYTALTAGKTVIIDSAIVKEGKLYIIKDEAGTAGINNITIDPDGTQTINGAATATINTNYGIVRVYSDGTNWFTF